jgi:hypothetical protein
VKYVVLSKCAIELNEWKQFFVTLVKVLPYKRQWHLRWDVTPSVYKPLLQAQFASLEVVTRKLFTPPGGLKGWKGRSICAAWIRYTLLSDGNKCGKAVMSTCGTSVCTGGREMLKTWFSIFSIIVNSPIERGATGHILSDA